MGGRAARPGGLEIIPNHVNAVKAIAGAGRHSLLIYIVHQPVIMGVLYVLGLTR